MRTTFRILTVAVATAFVTTLGVAPSHARPAWDTSPVRVVKHVKPTPKVVNMRVGEHRNFDRVVIDLRGKLTGYKVRYVKRLIQDGSGDPVRVPGRKVISVVLTPARTYDAAGESVYEGPRRARVGLEAVRQVVFVSDFEGYVSFGIALRRKENFRVFTLHQPNRLVIDVHH